MAMKRLRLLTLVTAWYVLTSSPAHADEGMWTFNDFPSAKVKEAYGFSPSPEWLDRVRLSSLRLAGGCSASLVGADGLVLTNHHCAHRCIEQVSDAKHDYVATGFLARSRGEERQCPAMELNQLVAVTDVTARIGAATKGLSDKVSNDARKAEMSRIEKECADGDGIRCEVVTLYHGGRYELYRYRRFQDARLVFAPEFPIAFFGGDPDNFNFPRFDLDFALLRIYQDGKPLRVDTFMPLSPDPLREDELVFVSGNPGGTNRRISLAQLEFERDVNLPRRLLYTAELRGLLGQFQTESAERKRIATAVLFSAENSYKARMGRWLALHDPAFLAGIAAKENELRARVDSDPNLRAHYGAAWDGIAKAMATFRPMRDRYTLVEAGLGFNSELFRLALLLVRAGDELGKPNEQRLREFTDAKLPALRQQLFSKAPIHDDLEIATLSFSLTKLREALGADDPFVVKVLGKQSPLHVATRLVKGSWLRAMNARQRLFDGGQPAIVGSTDPLIRFVRDMDPDARAVRKAYEDLVEAPMKRNGELIAKAYFAAYGTGTYPDATFTARLSYGQVKGWREGDHDVVPLTTLGGAFDRATGEDPFKLPSTWLRAKPVLNLSMPFNVSTTNDIIGGNSGSPLIDRQARVVGVIFDGNIHSLAGDYAFVPALNRSISVASTAIFEALDKIYGAKALLEELRAGAVAK